MFDLEKAGLIRMELEMEMKFDIKTYGTIECHVSKQDNWEEDILGEIKIRDRQTKANAFWDRRLVLKHACIFDDCLDMVFSFLQKTARDSEILADWKERIPMNALFYRRTFYDGWRGILSSWECQLLLRKNDGTLFQVKIPAGGANQVSLPEENRVLGKFRYSTGKAEELGLEEIFGGNFVYGKADTFEEFVKACLLFGDSKMGGMCNEPDAV